MAQHLPHGIWTEAAVQHNDAPHWYPGSSSSCPYECLGDLHSKTVLMDMSNIFIIRSQMSRPWCAVLPAEAQGVLCRGNVSSGVTTGCPPQSPCAPLPLCPKPSLKGFHLNLHTWHYISADVITIFNTMRLQNLSTKSTQDFLSNISLKTKVMHIVLQYLLFTNTVVYLKLINCMQCHSSSSQMPVS